MFVLGIDPALKDLGVAVVEIGAAAPYPVHYASTMAIDAFLPTVRQLLGQHQIAGACLEGIEWQGAGRGRRLADVALAVGRCHGVLEALGVAPCVLLRRAEVLRGLGLGARAAKEACAAKVRAWTKWSGLWTQHEADAVAVAIVGAGRLQGVARAPT